jgi:hypothetical protein
VKLTDEDYDAAMAELRDNGEDEGPSSLPPPEDDDEATKPLVLISTALDETVSQALALLPDDPELYQRGGQLVRILHEAEPGARDTKTFAPGTPRISPLDVSVLRYRLSVVARWAKRVREKDGTFRVQPARPDTHTVAAIHTLGEWPNVRPIVGVLESPILRPDGSLCSTPGYDDATAYVYEPTMTFPKVAERPTREDARHALEVLEEPFLEFPWATPACLSAALCAVLSLVARPAILGPCPAILIDKNTPGTGGSLCTDAISIIATGRISARMSWPPTQEELAKVLDAYALRSAAFVNFDNIPPAQSFAGSALDKYLTAESVECRVLGKSEAPMVRWRAVMVGSGNNLTVAGDTIRRVLLARMETELERPQDRDGFRIPDLRAWVRDNRARLVHAALTILRAFIVAGRPTTTNPLDARIDAENTGDPELAAHGAILLGLPRLAPDGTTIRAAVAALYPNGKAPPTQTRDGEPLLPDGHAELRDALEALAPPKVTGLAPDPKRLGNQLRRFLKVVRAGKRLTTKPDRNGVAVWSVEAVS